MAISKTGGAFGFLQKSIGGIVYSVSTASIKGLKKQVARSKPTSMKNPRTISQIVQRMKVVPAQKFYEAFEKAAGSVENNPLSHSFQGIAYGNKNKLRFMQLAMQGEPKAYVPKGVTFPAPGVYQVSEGSLPSLPSGVGGSTTSGTILPTDEALDGDTVAGLLAYGLEVGDQVTLLALINEKGQYRAAFGRVIIGVGNKWSWVNDPNASLQNIAVNSDGILFQGDDIACAATIVSRGTSSSSAKRSTAVMTIAPNFQGLMSAEAFDAAIDSYVTGITYNSLNSEWYLNQGSSQAFNGEVTTVEVKATAEDKLLKILVGRRSNGASLQYVIFKNTVDSEKLVFEVADAGDGVSLSTRTTLAAVRSALGNVNIVEEETTLDKAGLYFLQMMGK